MRHRHGHEGAPHIPQAITHANADAIRTVVAPLLVYQPGPVAAKYKPPVWGHQEAVFEFLLGRSSFWSASLTGKERFDAQGLEGKVQVRKPLFNVILNLDLLPEHRGRVLTGAAMAAALREAGDSGWRTR